MIAANHPSLGAAVDQQRHAPIVFRVVSPSATPAPASNPPAAPNEITPFAPAQGEPQPPENPIYEGPPVEIVTAQAPPVAPASASVAAPTPDTSSTGPSFSFMDWLTAETIAPGYPNGLPVAAGVVALAWIFSGKKGRRR